jgi:S-DNA-T family DNA segregation ATPase FtsK/SpoIIIE
VGLVAAEADFVRSPHLLLTGDPECGLSNALAAIARAIMRCYGPDEAQIYVVDPKNALVQVVQGQHLGHYVGEDGADYEGYTYYEDDVRAMATHLDGLLAARLPRSRVGQDELAKSTRSWTGPEIFVFIDDEQLVAGWHSGAAMFAAAGSGPALDGLVKYADRGREVGMHLVVGRRLHPWGSAMSSPVSGKLIALTAPTVIMDGPREEGALIKGVKASRQPAGRGVYVTDKLAAPVQIAQVLPL